MGRRVYSGIAAYLPSGRQASAPIAQIPSPLTPAGPGSPGRACHSTLHRIAKQPAEAMEIGRKAVFPSVSREKSDMNAAGSPRVRKFGRTLADAFPVRPDLGVRGSPRIIGAKF